MVVHVDLCMSGTMFLIKWINRINNALFEYADGMHPSEVLAIIDLPFWENGKNPMKNGIAGAKKMVNEWITDAIRQ